MSCDFLWLQKWYSSQCNGDWEHDQRVLIETIDNPGWSITINLIDTEYQDKEFQKFNIQNSESDWLFCFKDKFKFESRCGPNNLSEAIRNFRLWIEKTEKT